MLVPYGENVREGNGLARFMALRRILPLAQHDSQQEPRRSQARAGRRVRVTPISRVSPCLHGRQRYAPEERIPLFRFVGLSDNGPGRVIPPPRRRSLSLESWYWYGSIFLWLFFTGIGIPPVPEELAILYPVGLTAEHPEVRWWVAWPLTIAGILTADMVLYAIGRFGGRRLLRYRWIQRVLSAEREEKLERGFHRHGGKIILTARMIPPLRTSAFITAGLIRYPFVRFVLADSVCAIALVSVVFLGFRSIWEVIRLILEMEPEYWGLALLIVLVSGYLVYRYVRLIMQKAATGDVEPPHLPDLIHPGGQGPSTSEKESPVREPEH
jgi:membrane protein DedA with SNARE-associated domain